MSWVSYTAQNLNTPILNQGVNGNTLREMLLRLTVDVLDLKPEFCILCGGTNDVYQGIDPDLMNSNFKKMAERILEHKIRPIVALPAPVEDEVFEKDLAKFRRWLKKYAKENDLPVIDFYSSFIDPKKKKVIASYFEDGVHPSSKGYQAMAKTATDVLKGVLKNS